MSDTGVVRVTYDPSVDAAMIYLKHIGPGDSKHQQAIELDSGHRRYTLILDFSGEGELLGLEFLDARSLLPATLIEAAAKD